MAECEGLFGAADVDAGGDLEVLVEADRCRRVEDDCHLVDDLLLVLVRETQVGLLQVTLQHVHLVQALQGVLLQSLEHLKCYQV